MPKETFNNLKPDKKKRIEQAALNEFSEFGYFNSKISRIAKNSGISVGSFYQYFDDINDLFMTIFLNIGNVKFSYIANELKKVKDDSFESKIKAMYAGGVRFAINEPDSFKVASTFKSLMQTPAYDKISRYYVQSDAYDFIEPIITEAREKGEIREDMSIELFIKLLSNIQLSIIEYIGLCDNEEKFTEENMEKMSAMAVDILLNGIGK